MEPWLQTVLTIFGSVLASSGFWAYLQKRSDSRDCRTDLLLGLAHDRIMQLSTTYLERGDWITQDEYENLCDYLYVPYERMGGNGTAKRVVQEVQTRLKIVKNPPFSKK